MKLLLDHNLSRRLVPALIAAFPGSTHVALIGMDRADDANIWTYAAANGFTIVTKDTDFHQRAFLLGHPPKVVWIRLGNCSTKDVEDVLLRHASNLIAFDGDSTASLLALS